MEEEKKVDPELAKEIAGLSKDETQKRIRSVEHRINTLEWDRKRNQIHPHRLYQLNQLKDEKRLLREHERSIS